MGEIDTEAILQRIYGNALTFHADLHDRSDAHRLTHGPGCDVYPSDPANAPLWPLLAAAAGAKRMLEVGCGLGCTAALMAEAGGPGSRVDTIEAVEEHANLAEEEFKQRGLGGRIRILRGRAQGVLPNLRQPYHLVFVDADWAEYANILPHLLRLTGPGGFLISANLFPLFADWARDLPQKEAVEEYLTRLVREPGFRTYIFPGIWHALSYHLKNMGRTSS